MLANKASYVFATVLRAALGALAIGAVSVLGIGLYERATGTRVHVVDTFFALISNRWTSLLIFVLGFMLIRKVLKRFTDVDPQDSIARN